MSEYRDYKRFELWRDESWKDRLSRIDPLVRRLSELGRVHGDGYTPPGWSREEEMAHYHNKTGSIDDPSVRDFWEKRGITYQCRDLAGHWMAVLPTRFLDCTDAMLPLILVCLHVDYDDYYWAMKILSDFREFHHALEDEDFIVIYSVSNNGPDLTGTYVNVIQEASVLYPCNTELIYLDLSVLHDSKEKLREIKDLFLLDPSGKTVENPDSQIKRISNLGVPVLNVAGNWENRGSLARDLVMSDKYSTADFERHSFIRSETGLKLMQGIGLEYDYDRLDEPDFSLFWKNRNLDLGVHSTRGRRWLTLSPCSYDQKEGELPLFCVMQEVYRGNEHSPVTALGYFFELTKIAAGRECMLLFFALEDQDSNDLLSCLITEAAEQYPVDTSRVYVTGHSHNGKYALEFGRRNYRQIAAVATLGNFMGLESPAVLGDSAAAVSDEKVDFLSSIDLPLINLCGCCEHGGKLPVNRDGKELPLRKGQEFGRTLRLDHKIEAWQRRLRSAGCPVKSKKEILGAAESSDRVEQKLGFPVDSSQILMQDGFEHYIGDIRNRDGKSYLRMVGVENTPHVPTPSMLNLAWSFVRRFAREGGTGSIVELDREAEAFL